MTSQLAGWRVLGSLLLAACALEASPSPPPSSSLAAFAELAEHCARQRGAQVDSVAAACVCKSINERAAAAAVRCFATKYLLGFVGDSVPLPPMRRSPYKYYGLAFAPRGLNTTATEQIEVFNFGYGVAAPYPGLPTHWYLLTYCAGCD